jgi:uncharacterized membrane protein YebE (DUF533 family)
MKPVSVLCAALLVASGCETMEQNKGATGAAVGAGAGALAGALIGGKKHRTRNVLIGAALGAVAGYAIGKYIEHRTKTAQQTNVDNNYQPTQGTRLELVGVAANPAAVTRGSQVDLQATYALMAADVNTPIQVTETRSIMYNGQQLTQFGPRTVNYTPGTYTSQAPMSIPQDATPGNYELVVTVAAAGQQKQDKAAFTVN